jgi:hypothetical protein
VVDEPADEARAVLAGSLGVEQRPRLAGVGLDVALDLVDRALGWRRRRCLGLVGDVDQVAARGLVDDLVVLGPQPVLGDEGLGEFVVGQVADLARLQALGGDDGENPDGADGRRLRSGVWVVVEARPAARHARPRASRWWCSRCGAATAR